MQCYNCRSQLPEGAAFCQQCGASQPPPPPPSLAPTVAAPQPPYNNPGSDANYNLSSQAPTVMASPSSSGGSDANYDPLAPTIASSPPAYGNPPPYTNYNPSSTPGGGQPYEAVQNPYSNVPYGQPQPGNVPPYAPPPPSNIPPYTPPLQSSNAYGVGGPPFVSPPPAKPKSKAGLIIGIVIAVLLLACVGCSFAVISLARTGSQGSTPAATPTPSTPSGNTIDSTAASIITNIQMASAVDTNTAKPTTLATSFHTNTDFYVTFQFRLSGTGVSQQNPGYVLAKYYKQNELLGSSKPLVVDDSAFAYGYFPAQYDTATTAGAVELYWCQLSNCSDGKLAGITTFTVS